MEIVESPSTQMPRLLHTVTAVLSCLMSLFISGCVASGGTTQGGVQKTQNESPYTGLWVAPETDKTSFELDLTQNGSLIEGFHAALVGDTGNIEAALRTDRDGASVRGHMGQDGSAMVRFELRKYKGSGEATLSLKGDRLKWKLISASGDPVLPKSCVLLRQTGALH